MHKTRKRFSYYYTILTILVFFSFFLFCFLRQHLLKADQRSRISRRFTWRPDCVRNECECRVTFLWRFVIYRQRRECMLWFWILLACRRHTHTQIHKSRGVRERVNTTTYKQYNIFTERKLNCLFLVTVYGLRDTRMRWPVVVHGSCQQTS